MACSYSLNINGQVVQFGEGNNNYADLFDFLIAHKNQIEYGLISDIVLSQDTKQAEIVAKLRGIRSEARLVSRLLPFFVRFYSLPAASSPLKEKSLMTGL